MSGDHEREEHRRRNGSKRTKKEKKEERSSEAESICAAPAESDLGEDSQRSPGGAPKPRVPVICHYALRSTLLPLLLPVL